MDGFGPIRPRYENIENIEFNNPLDSFCIEQIRLQLQQVRFALTCCISPSKPTRAGWSSKINQLVIGEALSDEFDGRILNPHGVEIDLPFWVFKRLKKLHLLERDRVTGRRRIQERVFGLMDLWDGPDFRPDRCFRAFDPGYQRARSKDSGYASAFLKALGRDCSGLVNPAVERTRNFESDLDHSRLSDEYRRVRADEIIREVRAKKRRV